MIQIGYSRPMQISSCQTKQYPGWLVDTSLAAMRPFPGTWEGEPLA
jgi:hypothetical protein